MATDTTAITNAPDGKAAGATTNAASSGGAAGATVATAVAAIIVYVCRLAGIELGPIEPAVAIVLAPIGAYAAAHFMGKRTPTDQVRERETTIVQALPDGVTEALAALAAQAGYAAGPRGSSPDAAEAFAADVVASNEPARAGEVPEGLAAGGPSVSGSSAAPAAPVAAGTTAGDVAAIVDPVTVEVEARP